MTESAEQLAELKPCPLCGGDAEMDTQRAFLALGTGNIGHAIAIYCLSCPLDVSLCYGDVDGLVPEMVVELWNRRARDAELSAASQHIEAFVKEVADLQAKLYRASAIERSDVRKRGIDG